MDPKEKAEAERRKVDLEDRDDVIEWKRPGGFLHVEDRLPWLIAEHEAEERQYEE